MSTFYVAGFLHSAEFVLLVRKNQPEWQAGKLNGVGGKMEMHELALDAMRREFHEETGHEAEIDWSLYCVVRGGPVQDQWWVHFFTARVAGPAPRIADYNDVGERLLWVNWRNMLQPGGQPHIPNLDWLIPLSRDQYR